MIGDDDPLARQVDSSSLRTGTKDDFDPLLPVQMLSELSLLHADARVVESDTLPHQLHELVSLEDVLF